MYYTVNAFLPQVSTLYILFTVATVLVCLCVGRNVFAFFWLMYIRLAALLLYCSGSGATVTATTDVL